MSNDHNHYVPPVTSGHNYLNHGGWGNSHQTKSVANSIDHVADKTAFATEMIQTALSGIDSIQIELVAMSSAINPPTPDQLRALAHRLETVQRQVGDGLGHVRKFMHEINKATDVIQQPRTQWGG